MNNIKYLIPPSDDIKAESAYDLLIKSRAANFYRNYLKHIRLFRYTALFFIKFIYFNAGQFSKFSLRKKALRSFRLTSPKFFLTLFGSKSYKLLDPLKIYLPVPIVYPHKLVEIFSPLSENFPQVLVIEIPNAYCYSQSNIVTHDSYAVHHSLYNFDSDTTSEELHKIHKIYPNNRKLIKNILMYRDLSLDCAANFMDACSGNYAHWLTEVLPRILVFCDDERFKSIPILVDLNLHKNIISSLSSVVDSGREIYFVDKNVRLKIDKLFFIDVVGYVPFGRRNGYEGIHSDGIFHFDALKNIRAKFCGTSARSLVEGGPKKIFLKRGNSGRSVINSEEIETVLKLRGYDLIDTSSMSFIDQVKLFHNATHVISATGSALANCLFCQEGASVLVLMGQHEDMIYGYWRNMLSPLGLSVSYILGDIDDLKSSGIHGNFRVDLNDLEAIFSGDSKW